MTNNDSAGGTGIGFCGILAILFIGLKLIGIIDWSWWWVLAPLWIPATVVTALLLVVLICWFIAYMIGGGGNHRSPYRYP